MTIAASDLVCYGAASRPEDDASTTGGAIDAAARPLETQATATEAPDVVSTDAGDSMNLTIKGRDAGGEVVSETQALNGTTPVSFSTAFGRILNMTLASGPAGTVTVSNATDGTLHAFGPGETAAFTLFQQADSESAQTVRYEKVFWRNDVGDGTTLSSATVTLTADPSANARIALASAKDDSESVANRETEPSSIGAWTDDGVAVSVPGGSLADGEAIGVWVELTLAGAESATKTSVSTKLDGDTT